ncbi:sensor histidine kinase [Paenibacillus whitsoniae]|uniref:histidine kinase n=1 Tax=Paenibacillus whitsoniae TaxID=2496558 RepID=A0A3S0IE73_9BACL|nr:histidine kinase [Paenibacillus whitsoniae]RTE10995.1 sensor histidine kinase [Paenibacillus whitsoniae]
MTYKQMKWLILTIPTVTLALWEYSRHHLFLDYMSMEVGNWLAPLIELAVSITFLLKLFSLIEKTQEELNLERSRQAAMKERERIARELHDGIAQSLFLLSIKMDQLEGKLPLNSEYKQPTVSLRNTVYQVNEYVRQAISNLRYPIDPDAPPWTQYLSSMVTDFISETGLDVEWKWGISEERLSTKEKIELYASIREALLNVRKHAQASHVWVQSKESHDGTWSCSIEDDGRGMQTDPFAYQERYGLKMMRERAADMGWHLSVVRELERTRVEISKAAA